MARILLSREFVVDGLRLTLTAGIKNGSPLVVFGIPDATGYNQLQNITIEYPMKSQAAAMSFVAKATSETAERGLRKYQDEYRNLADRVNTALNAPYREDKGYKRRGD